ncbi:L,D-transpeptidase [Nocardia sp. NPDC020380]|uniref:L,D-transpeptidase n=1 Tax=Nocardia sp. NPDC020380 TaxID=3364309 RepID=UPI0037967E2A
MPRIRHVGSVLAAVAVFFVVSACGGSGRNSGPSTDSLQPSYHGPAQQLITVVSGSPTHTAGRLTAWQRNGDRWVRVFGPLHADLGADGIGVANETTAHTPAGTWPLTEAFGIQPNPGTRLPYRQVTDKDWWVSDPASAYYNTHYTCAPGTCPFKEEDGEDLGEAGPAYDHAVVIDYNRSPVVPGNGSAIFLHVGDGNPTAGCVTVPGPTLVDVMRWLDPADHPVIDISVAE